MSGHQSANMQSDVWLTPPEVIKSLGEFDLDPCAPVNRPWDTAKKHYTIEDNGLLQPWFDRVWLNPPYGKEAEKWLEKLVKHYNGIALLFARTETEMFQRLVFRRADSILFIAGRLTFYRENGIKASANSGAPSVLIAYGRNNVDAIGDSGIAGKHLMLNSVPMIIVGVSPSWKTVINITLTRMNGEAELQEVYEMVERIAPDKIQNNLHWKEKIRQQIAKHFNRIETGKYSLAQNT